MAIGNISLVLFVNKLNYNSGNNDNDLHFIRTCCTLPLEYIN